MTVAAVCGLGASVAAAGFIATPVEYETDSRPIAIAIGKLDPGPTKDIAVAHRDGRSVAVLYGDGDGGFTDAELLDTMNLRAMGVAIAKVDADNRPDLVVSGDSTDPDLDKLLVLRGKQGGFRAPKPYPLPTTVAAQVGAADLNRDGHIDAVVGDSNSNSVVVKYGKRGGAFGKARNYGFRFPDDPSDATEPQNIVIGDFDRDGFKDAAVGVGRLQAVGVLYTKTKRKNGKLRGKRALRKRVYDAAGWPYGLAKGDLDRDGRLDLVTPNDYNVGSESISILYGKGKGRKAGFKPVVELDLGEEAFGGVAIGRFNPDSRPDIAVSGNSGDLHYLYGEAGGFSAPNPFGSVSGAIAIAAGRLNADIEDDVVVGQWDEGNISVVLDEE